MTRRQEIAPAIREMVEQPLSIKEWERRLAEPLAPDELEATRELVRWFTRRYPTAKERLAYVRRKYAEWTGGPASRRE